MPDMSIREAHKQGFQEIGTLSTGLVVYAKRYGKFRETGAPQREYIFFAASGGVDLSDKKVTTWCMPEIYRLEARGHDGWYQDRKNAVQYYLCLGTCAVRNPNTASIREYAELIIFFAEYIDRINAENVAEFAEHGAEWIKLRAAWDRAETIQARREKVERVARRVGHKLAIGERAAVETSPRSFRLYEGARGHIIDGGHADKVMLAEQWVRCGKLDEGVMIRFNGDRVRVKQVAFSPF